LDRGCHLIGPADEDDTHFGEVVAALATVGCRCVDYSSVPWKHKDMWNYMFRPNVGDVMTCLLQRAGGNAAQLSSMLQRWSRKQCEAARAFVCHQLVVKGESLDKAQLSLVRRLPVFEPYGDQG